MDELAQARRAKALAATQRQEAADRAKLMREGLPMQTYDGPLPSDHPENRNAASKLHGSQPAFATLGVDGRATFDWPEIRLRAAQWPAKTDDDTGFARLIWMAANGDAKP